MAIRRMDLPVELVQTIDCLIEQDDVVQLSKVLKDAEQYGSKDSEPFQRLLLAFLYRAITLRSKRAVTHLLRNVNSIDEDDEINKRNCLHRMIIAVGRARHNHAAQRDGSNTSPIIEAMQIVPAEAPVLELASYGLKEIDSSQLPDGGDDAAEIVEFLVDELSERQQASVASRDSFGRTPLHYAAKYGFVKVSAILMGRMLQWKLLDLCHGLDSKDWSDLEGHTPLHLSVMGGWRLTTETLLNACRPDPGLADGGEDAVRKWGSASLLVAMATQAGFPNIVRLLVRAGADINYRDEQGETALHVAARKNHILSSAALLEGSDLYRLDLEVQENVYGWTPLLVASVDGKLAMVKLLVDAGAEVDKQDTSGWTAKEHAALRGHIEVAKLLGRNASCAPRSSTENILSTSGPKSSSIQDRGSAINKENRPPQPVKQFGHRYLTNESMVLVSLGSMDCRKTVKPVELEHVSYAEAHATQLDTALSIIVSASGATGEPTIIDLPVQENINTEPIAFMTKDASKTKLIFDIVPTYSGSKDHIIGRGVALLSSIKPTIGSKRMNLQGDLSVPIIASKTLDIIGSVHFNFIVVTPFTNPNMAITENKTYWKKITGPMVIGHRGLGKNTMSQRSLQLGENTMQSFVAAANLGASYVEFDVQLTKDLVPVIYHDFLVSETGIDAPMHTLTLEQFLQLGEGNTPRTSRTSSPSRRPIPKSTPAAENIHNGYRTPGRSRANSAGTLTEFQHLENKERMKNTRDMKEKGFKGNTRGNFIQAPFTTLEEMLRKLPPHIGFNIEMKYPMLFESEEHDMDTYAVELNSFVDTVLKMVYDLAGERNMIFSSFHPDMCLLLSLKQPSIPILFLTDAGTSPAGDIRATSLQEAIRFASRWNLLGVVSSAEPLVLCPRLVRAVKENGLVCVSYGSLNNEPVNVKRQVSEGIDAVIVDSVLAIRKGLTGEGQHGSQGHGGGVDLTAKPESDSQSSGIGHDKAANGLMTAGAPAGNGLAGSNGGAV